MTTRVLYETGRSKALGWPMMLADMGLLLMAFFALMIAQSNTQANAVPPAVAEAPTRIVVPEDAESLLASLRDKRVPFEPLDLTMPLDLPETYAEPQPDRVDDLRRALTEGVSARNFFVERAGDAVVVSLGTIGNFAGGSAELDANALQAIRSIAAVIGDLKSEIAIEGHADSVPVTGNRYKDNWELAGARAVAVLRELSRSPGLSSSSLRAVSFGDQRPAVATSDPKERERNRRVEIRIRPI